ncbi:MAG TPA: hypothetical protein DCL54_04010 [Alphaproteobacteria bacterium]|nr:hypothetical protein [Alphaproteobacteria bacterium]
MESANNWPERLLAYRRLNGLTQEDFAARLDVSCQTISRWESGKQLPDPVRAQRLSSLLGISGLASSKSWAYRVSHAMGHEVLHDRGQVVIAVSEAFAEFFNSSPSIWLGKTLFEAVPGDAGDKVRSDYADGQLPTSTTLGLFEGRIRQIFHLFDIRRGTTDVLRCAYDLWPIVTAEGQVLAHLVFHIRGPSPEPELCEHYRILEMRVVPA